MNLLKPAMILASSVALAFLVFPGESKTFTTGRLSTIPSDAPRLGEPGPDRLARATLDRKPEIRWFPSRVEARSRTVIGSEITGRVLSRHVEVSDPVAADQVLFRIDTADAELAAAEARAGLHSAEAEAARAESDAARFQGLLRAGAASRKTAEETATRLEIARKTVEARRAAVDVAALALSRSTVRAPREGRIVELRAEAGDRVSAGQPLLALEDPRSLEIVVDLPERLGAALRTSERLFFSSSDSEVATPLAIKEIRSVVDPATRTRRVALVPTADRLPHLVSGQSGRVGVKVGETLRVTVPVAAVERLGTVARVRVRTDDGLRERLIEVADADGDRIPVIAGLLEGENVLVPEALASVPHRENESR